MNNYRYIGVLIIGACFTSSVIAQDLLKKEEAVALALENNFDIRGANNDLKIAENNSSINNSGYLPSVSGSVGANYTLSNQQIIFQDGGELSKSGIATTRYNASVGLNYTIFDGFSRQYNYKILQENYNITELQARLIIENSIINIFSIYYEIARLLQNKVTQQETMDISKDRWTRAKYSFEYGQNTQLDVLNAEVDFNNDSIQYLTISQELANQKRNLNVLLGRDVSVAFSVDTTLVYAHDLSEIELLSNAKANNVSILQNQGSIRNAEHNMRVTGASNIPKLGLNASYGWSLNNLGPTAFAAEQSQVGPSIGASLSWNIYDGGLTKTRKQNAFINLSNQQLNMDQVQLDLERQIRNAWTIYQTALFVLEAERKNLETNERNFERTKEQYTLGQVTSIVFRQAQLNLLNAKLNFNQSKYSAKTSELALLQLSGDLLSADY